MVFVETDGRKRFGGGPEIRLLKEAMTMQTARLRFLATAILATAMAFVYSPNAWGQASCVAFTGVTHAYSPVDDWFGQSWLAFGTAQPRYAYQHTVGTGYEKSDGDVWIGSEKATLDFGGGDTFQFITRWVAHHMNNQAGVFEYEGIGTIANGTGKFKDVTGFFVSPGAFGPGMAGDQITFLWLGSYQGTICGLTPALTTNTAESAGTLQPKSLAIRLRR